MSYSEEATPRTNESTLRQDKLRVCDRPERGLLLFVRSCLPSRRARTSLSSSSLC